MIFVLKRKNMVSGKFISSLSMINPLSTKGKHAIANLCAPTQIRKNYDLQTTGQTCKTIYFVQTGAARIYYYKNGKEVTEYFAFENDLIIRAESLFTGKPSTKAIQAVSDTLFVALPSHSLFALFDKHRDIERLFRKIVEHSYVDTINRLESLQFHSAEERYESLMGKSPEVIQKIPLKHIASYLGITQVSLSRIRAKMS